jgi:hypothetical protein
VNPRYYQQWDQKAFQTTSRGEDDTATRRWTTEKEVRGQEGKTLTDIAIARGIDQEIGLEREDIAADQEPQIPDVEGQDRDLEIAPKIPAEGDEGHRIEETEAKNTTRTEEEIDTHDGNMITIQMRKRMTKGATSKWGSREAPHYLHKMHLSPSAKAKSQKSRRKSLTTESRALWPQLRIRSPKRMAQLSSSNITSRPDTNSKPPLPPATALLA